jgi:thioredoxin 2
MHGMNEDIRLHLACPHCQATNRLPARRIDDAPVCGRCGQPLLQGQPLELGDADFDAVVAATRLPVLVDFWAAWCGPCQAMAPAFKQAAHQLAGKALLVKVNSDQNPQLSARFGIRSIPTLVRLQDGQETRRQAGAVPAAAIVALAGA